MKETLKESMNRTSSKMKEAQQEGMTSDRIISELALDPGAKNKDARWIENALKSLGETIDITALDTDVQSKIAWKNATNAYNEIKATFAERGLRDGSGM